MLEENDKNSRRYQDKDIEYYVECIGDFGKGTVDADGKQTFGREYIWYFPQAHQNHGMPPASLAVPLNLYPSCYILPHIYISGYSPT